MKEVLRNKVSKLRTRAGLTQQQLADRIGVTRQTIIAIEKGNYTPSAILALKIAKLFKTEVGKIFILKYEK